VRLEGPSQLQSATERRFIPWSCRRNIVVRRFRVNPRRVTRPHKSLVSLQLRRCCGPDPVAASGPRSCAPPGRRDAPPRRALATAGAPWCRAPARASRGRSTARRARSKK